MPWPTSSAATTSAASGARLFSKTEEEQYSAIAGISKRDDIGCEWRKTQSSRRTSHASGLELRQRHWLQASGAQRSAQASRLKLERQNDAIGSWLSAHISRFRHGDRQEGVRWHGAGGARARQQLAGPLSADVWICFVPRQYPRPCSCLGSDGRASLESLPRTKAAKVDADPATNVSVRSQSASTFADIS